MSTTEQDRESIASQVIGAVEEGEHSALEAVRKFVDTVDEALPDSEAGPRRQIIDSAFRMVEQLLKVSNEFAQNIAQATEDVLGAGK